MSTSCLSRQLLLCISAFNFTSLSIKIKERWNFIHSFALFSNFTQALLSKLNPEFKKNILNFGYGINYKYEGMLAHSFDRFYVVTKFILPMIGDLKFSKLDFDDTCAYMDNKYTQNTEARKYIHKYIYL